MSASAPGRLAAFICVATAITAPVVVAQPAPNVQANPVGIELRYEAFAGCPEREAFARNLDARQRGTVPSQAVQLEVRLRDLAAAGVEGSVIVRSASGARSARRIVASTCGEAADALALIAALALQGIEVEEVAPTDDTDEASTGKRKDTRDSRADRPRASDPGRAKAPPSQTPSEAGVVAATEPATTTTTAGKASAESASAPTRSTESEVIDENAGEVRATTSEDDPIEPDAERTMRAYVLISGGVAAGVLPSLQPFPELSLGVEQGPPGVLFWSGHAAFRISPDQTRHFDQGVVSFGWWTGLAALCMGARASALSASGCATLEVGALSAGADDTENPRDERRAWVALGPGLMFGYDIAPALRLSLRAELLTPLARYRLELPQGSAVHEPSALGLRAGLGASLWL
jgi:hypothetical protein